MLEKEEGEAKFKNQRKAEFERKDLWVIFWKKKIKLSEMVRQSHWWVDVHDEELIIIISFCFIWNCVSK